MSVYVFSKKIKDIQLSAHFKLSEFRCHDGSSVVLVNPKLVQALETLRVKLNKPITIYSAYRTLSYNKRVGGVRDSQHTLGNAADIHVSGMDPAAVAKVAISAGLFKGVGIYDTFTHVDVRPRLVNRCHRKYDYWDDRKHK
jgi:zinc D-Ala-D-Ala carboxypeptidase